MNSTIAWITFRGLFGRKRFLFLLPLPLILVGLTWLITLLGGSPHDFAQPVLSSFGMAVVIPVISLIVGASVLGSEIDDGTVTHILTKPVPRWQIVLSKYVVAVGTSAAVVGVSMFVAAFITDGFHLAWATAAASVVGVLAYSAGFLALSVVSRKPVLIGLIYIVVWEDILTNAVSGTRVLSVQHYVLSLSSRWASTDLLVPTVSQNVALIMSTVIVLAGVVIAARRLRSFSVAGETS